VQVVPLFAVAQSSEEQREPDQTVHHDHDNGEHGVAGKRWIGQAGQHDRTDRHDLDTANTQCQDQRSVGLAEQISQLVGVGDHRQCADHNGCEQPDEDRGA
jgi:hypothetical protein